MSLNKLVEMSHRYGENEEFVLAGGGNTSYKENGTLYVKGSGVQLSDILPEQFVAMDIKKLLEMVEYEYPESMSNDEREKKALADMMSARLPGEESKRPSVESILHAMFPYKFVLHVHPPLINGLTCAVIGEESCSKLFKDKAVWIELTKPGLILAQKCNRVFREYEKKAGTFPQIVILQNHGIFIAADTVDEIDDLMNYVVDTLEKQINEFPNFQIDALSYDMDSLQAITAKLKSLYSSINTDNTTVAKFYINKQIEQFVESKETFKPISKSFTPDHIVYCKDEPLFIEPDADIEAEFNTYANRKGFKPNIVAIRGVGFFALGSNPKKAMQAQALFLDAVKIATYAKSFGGANPLNDEFANFILNWEVEAYRSKA